MNLEPSEVWLVNKDMVLDLIERSHPDYDREMAEVLQSALTDRENRSIITADEIDDWIAKLFA